MQTIKIHLTWYQRPLSSIRRPQSTATQIKNSIQRLLLITPRPRSPQIFTINSSHPLLLHQPAVRTTLTAPSHCPTKRNVCSLFLFIRLLLFCFCITLVRVLSLNSNVFLAILMDVVFFVNLLFQLYVFMSFFQLFYLSFIYAYKHILLVNLLEYLVFLCFCLF